MNSKIVRTILVSAGVIGFAVLTHAQSANTSGQNQQPPMMQGMPPMQQGGQGESGGQRPMPGMMMGSSTGQMSDRRPMPGMQMGSSSMMMPMPSGKMQGGDSGQGQNNQGPQMNKDAPPIILTVDNNGHITVRGTLTSSSGSTLTIASWGLTFTVDASSAQVAGKTTSLSAFTVGDVIGVQGVLNASSTGMVAATVVRDWGTFQNPSAIRGLMSMDNHMMMGSSTMMMPMMGSSTMMMPPMQGRM